MRGKKEKKMEAEERKAWKIQKRKRDRNIKESLNYRLRRDRTRPRPYIGEVNAPAPLSKVRAHICRSSAYNRSFFSENHIDCNFLMKYTSRVSV